MEKIDLSKLNTEQQNPNTLDIDVCETQEILTKINQEDQKVAFVVEKQIPAITALVDVASACLEKKGRIIYIGAGTSGRLGVLDASECPPTYGVSSELVQGIMAGGNEAIFKAKEGAEDSKELACEDLKALNLNENDMVIGLAASGRTPYVMGGLEYANQIGAKTGSICCVENGAISAIAQYPIEVVTGAEAITGSTRMKAGTAQKLVLNMISTACMVKYGKVYHNLMVDVQPTNQKLIVRAINIIEKALGCTMDEAKRLFEESGRDVKVAITMGVSECDASMAKKVLLENNGNVSKTIHQLMKGRN